MNQSTVIQDPTPLNTNYLPPEFVGREDEEAILHSTLSSIEGTGSRHLFLHGPRGTGKTQLVLNQLDQVSSTTATCYIPCQRYDTQYKALKQLYASVTNEEIRDGHHTAALKRKIENRTTEVDVVVALDELDFLMLNDGDDLLYYLSRTNDLNTILISANHYRLKDCVEERTYSSLQPRQTRFESYTSGEIYQILFDRVQDALSPQSLQQEALTLIASLVDNPAFGLDWLRAAAGEAEATITESTVKDTRTKAHQVHTEALLHGFSDHHRLLYQAIKELSREHDSTIQTGEIYEHYQELCKAYSEDPLSNRRISDYLKHLELLNLIEAEYHYGGTEGKTREVRLNQRR